MWRKVLRWLRRRRVTMIINVCDVRSYFCFKSLRSFIRFVRYDNFIRYVLYVFFGR